MARSAWRILTLRMTSADGKPESIRWAQVAYGHVWLAAPGAPEVDPRTSDAWDDLGPLDALGTSREGPDRRLESVRVAVWAALGFMTDRRAEEEG